MPLLLNTPPCSLRACSAGCCRIATASHPVSLPGTRLRACTMLVASLIQRSSCRHRSMSMTACVCMYLRSPIGDCLCSPGGGCAVVSEHACLSVSAEFCMRLCKSVPMIHERIATEDQPACLTNVSKRMRLPASVFVCPCPPMSARALSRSANLPPKVCPPSSINVCLWNVSLPASMPPSPPPSCYRQQRLALLCLWACRFVVYDHWAHVCVQ